MPGADALFHVPAGMIGVGLRIPRAGTIEESPALLTDPWAARGRLLRSASDRRAVLSGDPKLAEHLCEPVRIRRR